MGDRVSNLQVCTKKELDMSIISNTSQQITVEVCFYNKLSRILGVYTGTKYVRRRELWYDLL